MGPDLDFDKLKSSPNYLRMISSENRYTLFWIVR